MAAAATTSARATQNPGESEAELSDYERKRLRNIARNDALLRQLGLCLSERAAAGTRHTDALPLFFFRECLHIESALLVLCPLSAGLGEPKEALALLISRKICIFDLVKNMHF
jgi:hypothetical protein